MVEVTTISDKKFFINPSNLAFAKPTPSGESELVLKEPIPKPGDTSRLGQRLRVEEGPEKLGGDLIKAEDLETEQYYFLNPDAILSSYPVKGGFRLWLSAKLNAGGPGRSSWLVVKENDALSEVL